MAEAYNRAGTVWEQGAGPVYNRLSEVIVGLSPTPWTGRLVLDVGAGTGAAGRAVRRAGGRTVALDMAPGMLAAPADKDTPAVVADARALPFADGAFDGVVAAFSLNHLDQPEAGLAEAARVAAEGAPIVVSSYAADDGHPVKAAVEDALTEAGWRLPDWYGDLRADAIPRLATPEAVTAAAAAAGLGDATVHAVTVAYPELTRRDLVAWRLAMAAAAPFVADLDADARERVVARALDLLGDAPVLRRSVLVLVAVASRASAQRPSPAKVARAAARSDSP